MRVLKGFSGSRDLPFFRRLGNEILCTGTGICDHKNNGKFVFSIKAENL